MYKKPYLFVLGIVALFSVSSIVYAVFSPSGGGTYRLGASIGTTNTSVKLSSFTEPVSGIKYSMSYLNTTTGYGTIDPQTTHKEFVSFTGITQNSDGTALLTGVTRGLSFSYPFTASTTLRQAHSGQSIFILSDSPQLFNEYAVKQNNELVSGLWTFSNPPLSFTAATSTYQFATVGYANGLTINGAPTSTENIMGVVQLPTNTQVTNGTASSTTGSPFVLPVRLATTTAIGTLSGYVPILNSGVLNPFFISTSSAYLWTGSTTFMGHFDIGSTATTTINPNATTSVGALYQNGEYGAIAPVGSVLAYASSSPPTGWLLANGSAVSRTTYARLFYIVGTTYGVGDGVTTFNLPNIGGRNILMASTTANVAQTGGESNHTLSVAEIPSHNHAIATGLSAPPGSYTYLNPTSGSDPTNGTVTYSTSVIQAAGGGGGHNILDPYIVMEYIIKF